MKNKTIMFVMCLLLSLITNAHTSTGAKKLLVFGDSYADTGNSKKPTAVSWKHPYGISFPGKPTGRFSDGRVLTDFVASFMGQESPVPYKLRESAAKSELDLGMNFAFGGTGVFNTMEREPNMSVQINFFEALVQEKVYTHQDLNSSIALVSLAGNDYATFLAKKGSEVDVKKDLVNLTSLIVNQLLVDLKRLQRLGIRQIGVTALEPLGCLPPFTASSSHQNCSEALNLVSGFHNRLLKQSLKDLKNQSEKHKIVVLDLYSAFMSAFATLQHKTTRNPMKPCCVGMKEGISCGSVDEKSGTKEYVICQNRDLSFFWDTIHPSQNGWRLVSSALQPSLHELVN